MAKQINFDGGRLNQNAASNSTLRVAIPEQVAQDIAGSVNSCHAAMQNARSDNLIIGSEDSNINPQHGRDSYRARSANKQIWELHHSRHTTALSDAPVEFEQRVVSRFQGA